MSKFTLFGSSSYTRASVLKTELEEFLGGEDALIVQDDGISTFRGVLVTMLQLPALMIGLNIAGLLLSLPLQLVLTRGDDRLEEAELETIAGERQIHFVGDHPLTRIADGGWLWLAGNWAVMVGVAVWDWRSLLLLVGLSLVVSTGVSLRDRQGYPRLAVVVIAVGFGTALWLLVAGYLNALLVGVFAVGSLLTVGRVERGAANRLLDDVGALVAKEEYDEVCLITDKSVARELLDAVEDTDLTVAGAFLQRWRGQGYRVDASGEPIDGSPADTEPLLRHVEDTPEDRVEDRVEARLLDWCVLLVTLLSLSVAGLFVLSYLEVALGFEAEFGAPVLAGSGIALGHLWLLSLLLPISAYYTITEGVWGRTWGKRRLGLQVRHTDGSPMDLRSAFVRTLAGWIDVLPAAFVVGGILAAGNDHGRRVGDLAAGTVVVEDSVVQEYASDTQSGERAAGDTDDPTDPESAPGDDGPAGAEPSQTPDGNTTATAEDKASDDPTTSDDTSVTEPEASWPDPEDDQE